jgi:hypothetical protein
MNDEDLERLAARLGTDVVAGLDLERVAGRVRARLEESEREVAVRRRRIVRRVMAMAAVLTVAILGRLAFDSRRDWEGGRARQGTVLYELDQLDADQLERLLETMPVTAVTVPPDPVPLQDLDTTRLERLLRSLEG